MWFQQLFYLFLVVSVIFVTLIAWLSSEYHGGYLIWPDFAPLTDLNYKLPFLLYSLWLFIQVLLALIVPGTTRKGTVLANGKRLDYNLNGFGAFKLTILGVIFLHAFELFDFSILVRNKGAFIVIATLYSLGISLFLWLKNGFKSNQNNVMTFWAGKELNPRVGNFDLKFFLEGRPGLLLWLVLDFAFLVELNKELKLNEMVGGLVTAAMHFIYVADYFYNEEAILTTMDITTENLGFKLCFGDMVWVPFLYSLHLAVYYHIGKSGPIPCERLCAISGVILYVIGFIIFRKANSMKNEFRSDPDNEKWKGKFISTRRGKGLLIKGMWGMARHMNYTGDMLMAWGMSVANGVFRPWNFFYPIFFTGLAVQRERIDEENCKIKYGMDWGRYCRIVPYRIIPLIY